MGSQFPPSGTPNKNETIVTRVIMIPIEVAAQILNEERQYRHYLMSIPGIVNIHFFPTGEIKVSYDVAEIEYDEILVHLEKMGLPISYSLWEHLKSAWFQYVDAATRTASEHKHSSSSYHTHKESKNVHRQGNKH